MSTRTVFSGAEFLITDTRKEDIFTPEDFSGEHKMVYKATADFVKKELAENAELIEEKNEEKVREWFRKAGELGLNAPDVPEDLGGEGMDKISACLVSEAMGGAHSFSVSHTCQTGIGSLPILLYGTEEQKKKYIPKLATGELIGAYCLTESGAGSDALNAQATAVLSEDGSHYLLNGEKIFITNGAWADVLTVFAKVDGSQFTGFIIEKGFEGFSTGAEEKKMGIKGSSTVPVILNNCRVPVENVLYEVGKGHHIAFNVLNIGRYKLGPSTAGASKAALAKAAQYAMEREQFGRKIGSFGMVQSKLAEMAIRLYMAETISYRLAAAIEDRLSLLDQDQKQSGAEISKAIEEYSIECAIAKVAASEIQAYVVDETVQIYGGNGYIAEYPAERAYRDARINRIFEGTNEINRLVITGNLFKKAMKGALPLFEAIGKSSWESPLSAKPDGVLGGQHRMLQAAKALFLKAAGVAGEKLGQNLPQEQEVVALLSDMIIQIYLMESGLLRASKILDRKGDKAAELHVAAVQVYCNDMLPQIANWAKTVFAYVEEKDVAAAAVKAIEGCAACSPANTIALRKKVAEKVLKGKKYPF